MSSLCRSSLKLSRACRPLLAKRALHSFVPRPATRWRWATFAVLGASASLVLSHNLIRLDAEIPGSYIDPETDIVFPPTLNVPSKFKIPTLTFLGGGVRRVSILKVKVYSVAIYADLANPNLKITKDMTADEKIDHVVRNSACVIRIVPTRTTGYSHLRDAFMRNMQQRAQLGKKAGTLTPELELEIQSPLRGLKSLFPSTSIEKGVPMDIFIPAPVEGRPRALVFRDMGTVESDWVTNEFLLSYTEGAGLSPALKQEMLKQIDTLI